MRKNKSSYNEDAFCALLDKTSQCDFDGHTDFDKLTPEQKLCWLSECAKFVYETRRD